MDRSFEEKICEKLESIDRRLLELEERFESRRISFHEREILMRLSYPAIKTFLVMEHGRTYAAGDVAASTGRHRAVESAILNKLFSLGVVEKKKVGKIVYYFRKE